MSLNSQHPKWVSKLVTSKFKKGILPPGRQIYLWPLPHLTVHEPVFYQIVHLKSGV